METLLFKPQNPLLKKHIQYFLFFRKNSNNPFGYKSFANTNICLALYQASTVFYNPKDSNRCTVLASSDEPTCRLYGAHQSAFEVEVHGSLDQVCVLFHPGSLKMFTREHIDTLFNEELLLSDIFKNTHHSFLNRLFDERDYATRVLLLESFFLRLFNGNTIDKKRLAEMLQAEQKYGGVQYSAGMSASTLYRRFLDHFGQGPKSYQKTIRFRKSLNVLAETSDFTQLALQLGYFDQSHFIRDFKSFTGLAPGIFKAKMNRVQNEFTWITNV
ncbi:Helix-turn-helix domain-containing protein [Zunongwangia mangrovi]|uniref:Helix-turn-helix domain-containing protein n=1 Tax=Zunongwangia mangrovi TaxID=1334022 RepID=A0A1I1MS83_9FLAO|nr:helix-turn-helix domain-containing protein [Zunongwangia mangrovi]SFC88304.1 Helix-turn-helix domain-containing protein [Zunongwangia mangrovi]